MGEGLGLRALHCPRHLHEQVAEHLRADVGVTEVGGLDPGDGRAEQVRIDLGKIVARKIENFQ